MSPLGVKYRTNQPDTEHTHAVHEEPIVHLNLHAATPANKHNTAEDDEENVTEEEGSSTEEGCDESADEIDELLEEVPGFLDTIAALEDNHKFYHAANYFNKPYQYADHPELQQTCNIYGTEANNVAFRHLDNTEIIPRWVLHGILKTLLEMIDACHDAYSKVLVALDGLLFADDKDSVLRFCYSRTKFALRDLRAKSIAYVKDAEAKKEAINIVMAKA
eukprot:comp23383_c4_seq1/m.38711 comp23383_c4_seq1/g.38711  ORF comp23383_c4_seq1/g.38711 comp23383_c4_seq1/m.38711 type:complete len:219 (-) comp23383_c4_seq1:124-780(-)